MLDNNNLPKLRVDSIEIDSQDNYHRDYLTAQIACLTMAGRDIVTISKILGLSTGYIAQIRASHDFQTALKRARTYIFDSAISKLTLEADNAVAKILDVLNDPEASNKIKLDAAKTVLSTLRQAKQDDVSDRLEAIEGMLNV